MNKSVLIAAALAVALTACGDNGKAAADAKAAADKAEQERVAEANRLNPAARNARASVRRTWPECRTRHSPDRPLERDQGWYGVSCAG